MCAEAGLSPEETQAALAFASNPKITSRLDTLVKTGTEDYSAQVGRVRAMETKLAEYGTWYGTASAQFQTMADDLAAAKAQLARGGGDPNNPNPNPIDTSKFLTKADLDRVVQDQGTRFAGILKQATHIAADHAARFGEAPDMEAIDTIAREKNLPLDLAYQQYIKPRVDAKATADMDKRIADAKAEAVRDYASRNHMPADPRPAENSFINPRGPKPDSPKDIDSELMAAWNGADKAAA